MVIVHTVDVIENQWHGFAIPLWANAATLTPIF
jgi:hypothetical protein